MNQNDLNSPDLPLLDNSDFIEPVEIQAGPPAVLAGLRVGLDGFNLGLEKGTGIATYARTLSFCLHDLGSAVDVVYGNRAAPSINPLLREIAFFDANVGNPPRWLVILRRTIDALTSPFGRKAVEVPITGRVIARQFSSKMPHFDRIVNVPDLFNLATRHFRRHKTFLTIRMRNPPKIMHWTYPMPIRLLGAKNIYTLHDLVPLRLPFTTLDKKRYYFNLIKKCIKYGDHICTVSETSKKDIIDIFKIREKDITNTYQAVSIPAKYRNKPQELVAEEITGAFGLPYKGYFLFYGSIEPKKNVGRLIEGYLTAKIDTPLVIIGAQAWQSEQELRLLDEDHIKFLAQIGELTYVKKRIYQMPYAPFPLLVSMIRGAKAVLFPSLYEGFGLPVLESMLLGTPVMSSLEGSIPEVAGDAALLVDPYDVRAIADAIKRLDSDAELRQRLSRLGPAQAARFDTETYLQALADMYRKVM